MDGEYYFEDGAADASVRHPVGTDSNAINSPYRASVIPPHTQRYGHLAPLESQQSSNNRLTEHPKHVFFYRDNNMFRDALKVVVNKRQFKNLDVLQNELSKKMPDLPRGCRTIFTPRGRERVQDIDELSDRGKYVCSSFKTRAKGLDTTKVAPPAAFHVGRATSGRRFYNLLLRSQKNSDLQKHEEEEEENAALGEAIGTSKVSILNEHTVRRRQYLRSYPATDSVMELDLRGLSPGRTTRRDYKRVYFRKSGEPYRKHLLILSRKTGLTFDSLLNDLSEVFQVRVRRIFTLDGRPVESISAIFNGPNTFVCSPVDYFRPRDAWVDNAERMARERRKKQLAYRTGSLRKRRVRLARQEATG